MKKVELLAPAGNFDCLKAAINNGANAVYLGGKNFSARAFANNFDENEIIEAVKYAHLRNVKVYVTLNTLLNEDEFNNAIKMVKFYYENNVDALLIQDLGLYYFIKTNYPDFEIHCSTQMHVHNIEGIKAAKRLGFKRVVVARESDLEFIKKACKQDIEIETFIHGAICVSYSGQCLMSSYSKNRSANKGMCSQCCRLKYDLYDENNNKIDTDTDYLLSPKDMCLINDIPKLIEAGVSSFKIEGRLKSSAYVGYVTSIYRKAIDSYYNNLEYKISDDEIEKLKVLFNRNFTDDYLFDKNNLFGQRTPNHLGIEIGEAFKYENGYIFIKLNKTLNQFDGIRINDFGCIVNMLYKDNLLVNSGNANDIVAIKSDEKQLGKVYKTQDYVLEKSINDRNEIKLPLDVNITIKPNENIIVSLSTNEDKYEYISDIKAQVAEKSPISKDNVINSFNKLNETEYYLNLINVETDNAFLPLKQINEIRRDSINKFNEYRLNSFSRKLIPSDIKFIDPKYEESGDITLDKNKANNTDNEYDVNYVINKDSIYSSSENALICEIGGLLRPYKSKIAYYTLNCSNSYCFELFKKLGFDAIIVSSELKEDQIQKMIESYKQRNNCSIKPYVLSKGNRVLMYIKAKPFDKYIENNKKYYLISDNNKYLLNINGNITEILENSDNNINKQLFTIFNY